MSVEMHLKKTDEMIYIPSIVENIFPHEFSH